MMYQILKKLLLVLLCLSLLSTCAFADDLTILEGENFNTFGSLSAADYGVTSVSWAVTTRVRFIDSGSTAGYENVALSDSNSSASFSSSSSLRFTSVRVITVTAAIPAGTLVVSSSVPFFTDMTVTSSSTGVTVTQSGSSLTIVSDGSTSPITLRGEGWGSSTSLDMSASFSPPSGGEGGGEAGSPSGSMNGIQGTRYAISSAYQWETYNQYIGVRKIMYALQSQGSDGGTSWNSGEIEGEELLYNMAASIAYDGYKWKIDPTTGALVFYGYDGGMAQPGSWLDMVFRYLTYDYYWGSRLWSNDVSGSWYGSISSSFSYLNYRVNQILEVLANDEDLQIKDATTEERNWVKDYFNGSGDKADSSKYDDLNDTGSAFKDAFAGAPDSSIADGFTAVNDNGYDFWSQEVSNDINGVSSSAASRAPAYVPPEQRIVDAYSENWNQIVGGYYD